MRQITLNDNPRVDAEKRLRQLIKRRTLIQSIAGDSFENASIYLHPKRRKRRELCAVVNKQIYALRKKLK
jgi:hypothetical protein